MNLEELLEKREEISQYLRILGRSHHRALFENDAGSGSLNQLRRNIKICLSDLCKLNMWLIDHNGGIRKNIKSMEKQENKLMKLEAKRRMLVEEKASWTIPGISALKSTDSNSIRITRKHQEALNAYIGNVGISNTSLNDTKESAAGNLSKEELIENIATLREANLCVEQEINQLEVLLSSLKKDQAFISKEISALESNLRGRTLAIDVEIENIDIARAALLRKVGLLKDKPPENGIFASRRKESVEDVDIAQSQLGEFTRARKAALGEMLTFHKEESGQLTQQLEAWKEIFELLSSLEENIHKKLISESKADPIELHQLIDSTINKISEVSYENCSSEVIACIKDEIRALELARGQLSIGKKTRGVERLAAVSENPSFLITGTSPPKVGITKNLVPLTPTTDGKKSV
ncbi:HCL263Wp [Eremothecium sinecaudum]|uniref:HCL263Wp n=1 Tax=Eremothecium sinecaudum TaxID=45286 RepID=A0A109UYD5_9SACH|nr:HCL263Wp [Eremothecium sinecaudum]AMD19888.1 HCL263Wp [Eremothecium sinecaudum]